MGIKTRFVVVFWLFHSEAVQHSTAVHWKEKKKSKRKF